MKTLEEIRNIDFSALERGLLEHLIRKSENQLWIGSLRKLARETKTPITSLKRALAILEDFQAVRVERGAIKLSFEEASTPTQDRPSSKQLALLARLREERGVKGSEPSTKKEAWLEIKKLKASEKQKKEEPRKQAPPPVEPPEEPGMISPEAFAAAFGEFLS
tara:strand:- start:691 stop:1179 length:489 start_codon:yes stop_codon:yes gene_type:complete